MATEGLGTTQVEALWSAAKANPRSALESALVLVDKSADPFVLGWAHAAAGRAHFELGANEAAIAAFEESLKTDSPRLTDRVTISLAAALAASGRGGEARQRLGAAAKSDDAVIVALAQSQLAMIELHAGNVAEALGLLEPAVEVLADVPGEEEASARALGNAGYCELLIGRLDSAIERFQKASELASQSGQSTVVAGCAQNIGYALMRKGDLVGALSELERAREHYREQGDPGRNLSTLLDDLAETYRIAGLTDDAVHAAKEALNLIGDEGSLEKRADATYRLARCQLDGGDLQAIETAGHAARLFREADRQHWVWRSELLAVEGRVELGETSNIELAGSLMAVEEFARSGWELEARSGRNLIALAHMRSGSPGAARAALGSPEPVVGDESVMAQIEGQLAAVLDSALSCEPLDQHVERAAELVEEHAVRLADPEMRAGAARLVNRLRALIVGHAIEVGDVEAAFAAEERFRALSFKYPRATPVEEGLVASLSQEVRDLNREIEEQGNVSVDERAKLRSLEGQLRRSSLQRSSESGSDVETTGTRPHLNGGLDSISDAVGDGQFVEWIELDGTVHVVTERTVETCGSVLDLQRLANNIRTDLARLARPGLRPDTAARRWDTLLSDCQVLARSLLCSVEVADDIAWVLSPPSFLIDLPWSLVLTTPTGSPRSVTVVPSATWWLRNHDRPAPDLRFGAVTGPELVFANVEAERLVSQFGGTAPASEAADAISTIERSTLLHVAAHGTFREDSPRFSSLRLDDGPLALHELDHLGQVPDAVVLAACSAGRHSSISGGDVLGFAPAWLIAGTGSVIAPVCPVGDEPTTMFVTNLYDQLSDGKGTSEALTASQVELAESPVEVRAAAQAFIHVGCEKKFVSPGVPATL